MGRKRVAAILAVMMAVTSCVSESLPIYAEDFISEESETSEFSADQDSFTSEDFNSENEDGFVSENENTQEKTNEDDEEELVLIDDKTFPDEHFRNYISSVIDENADGKLSSEEISQTRELNISNQGISDLTGIEVFTELKYLDGSENHLAYVNLPDFFWNSSEKQDEDPVIILNEQEISVTAEKTKENKWSISLADIVGVENLKKICDIECPVEMVNDHGNIEFSTEITVLPWITYNYSIGDNDKELSMDVKVNIDIEENMEFGTTDEISSYETENTYGDFEYTSYASGEATITKYKGNQSYLVIPEEIEGYKVTEIGDRAFHECTSLINVEIPGTVKRIGDLAFWDCEDLEEINLSNGVEYIGYEFIAGSKVKSVRVPATVSSSGVNSFGSSGAFDYANSLEEIVFEEGMEYIPKNICHCYSINTSLKKVTIPESVKEISENAFRNCTGIKNIIFGKNISKIDAGAFAYCSGIEEITFGKSISVVGNWAFGDCAGLKSVKFQENDEMDEVKGELRKHSVTIESAAFSGCISLENVILSSNVEEIQTQAFYYCTNLEELKLPEGVRYLGSSILWGTKIKSIQVPLSVEKCGTEDFGAFDNAGNLEEIIFKEGAQRVPDNICSNYEPNSVLKKIVIPDSVTEIGKYAFKDCAGIENIVFGKNISKIGNSAFYKCTGLKDIVFQENEENPVIIDQWAFARCSSLENVTLSTNIIKIEGEAFYSCTSLESLNIPEGVRYLGNTFIGETPISSIKIPSTVETSGRYGDEINCRGAFYRAYNLEEIVFADGMRRIPDYICAFDYASTTLKKVIIPESVTAIGEKAFNNCTNITIYGYTNSYAEIYATENNIPFVSIGESIGNCDYDYSSELDKWLLNKGTSNSFNYLVKESNFLCPVSVVANDADFAAGVTEAISNLAYRGLDGWKELANGATSRDQAREILVALLNAQSADVQGLAEQETAQKLSKLYVKTFQKSNWAYATEFGLNSTEINQLASICQEDKIADFFANDNYVSISGYLQIKGGFSENSKVVKCIESFGESKEMLGVLSDELELWGNILKINSITEETINYIYNVKSLLAADEMYSEMLKYIQNNCPYTPVRDAAGDLYKVIHGGAAEKILYASRSIAEEVEEKAVDAALKFLMKSVPYGELINDTYHYAVDLSNMLFKTKDIQQQKDNMRCVAYASRYISRWMIDCRSKYLTGADSEKLAYARKTVYGYYMLLQIRIAGEESFQKLMEITKKNNKRAYNVSKGIVETLKSNEKWMKDSGVLDEMSTSIVACPVDVSIYDSAGNCVYTLYDGAETSGYLNGIYYSVSYQPLDDDYIKVIRLPQNSGYTLKCNANDLGSVDYSLLTISDDGEMEKQEINNIPVDKGNTILVSGTSGQNTECSLEKEGEKVKEYKPETSLDKYIPVESLQAEKTELNLKPGEKSLLNVQILPENATEKQLIWNSSDEGIVTVNSDGVIVGKTVGKAAVTAKVLNEEKTVTFYITVVKETQTDPDTTPTPDPKPSVAPSPSPAPIPSQTPSPSPTQPGQCVHNWSTWKVLQKADVFTSEKQERTCTLCGKKEQKAGKKLTPFIKVNAATVTLKVKQSTSGLKVTQMAAGDSVVSWKSSNSKIVKVSRTGKLTAQKKVGKATVTVTLKSGISKKISVKVQKGAVKTTKITGLPSKITLNKGSQKMLKPVRQPFTSVEKITYSSSNKKVVSVTSKGKLKALKAGTAKITVKAGKKKFVIKVTVPKKKK